MPESLVNQSGAVLGAANATEQLGVSGYGGVAFQIQGTFSGTITFEATIGSEWVSMRVTASNSSTPVTTATAPGVYIGSAVGFSAVRARMSSYSSGGAHVLIRADLASPGGAGGGGGSGTDVNLIEVGGVPVALGQTTMASSFPVVIASDQSAIPITGSITASNPSVSATGAAVPADATFIGADDGTGNLAGLAAAKLDYATGGSTVPQTLFGLALPATSGPVAALAGHGTAAQALRVELPTDGTGVIATVGAVTAITNALPAGTNVIGHVIADSGSTTAVTGNVTVVQPTAANLNATVTVAAGSAVIGHVITDSGSVTAASQSGTWNITNVSGTVSLPTGASTLSEQQTQTTSLQLIDDAVATTGSAITAKGLSAVGTDGTNARILKTDTSGELQIDVLTLPSNASVNVAQFGGTNVVTGGTAGTQSVGGIQAHDAADSGNNPVKVGAKATSSEPTAVSSGDIANLITDLVGKLIVLPYANPENFVSGVISSAMTGTTSTSLIAAPASGLRNYITQITVSNTHATVGTNMEIQDGNGGTTFYIIPAAAVYGGATLTFPTPLRQPTTATAVYIKNTTTGASTFASASGYKGA